MSDYCSLFSQTFYGLLFSYLTNVTSQPKKLVKLTKSLLYHECFYLQHFTQKNNSCTPCVPMFYIDNNVVGHVKIPSTKPGSDRTGSRIGSRTGSHTGSRIGSRKNKTKVLKKKIPPQKNQIVYKIIINKK